MSDSGNFQNLTALRQEIIDTVDLLNIKRARTQAEILSIVRHKFQAKMRGGKYLVAMRDAAGTVHEAHSADGWKAMLGCPGGAERLFEAVAGEALAHPARTRSVRPAAVKDASLRAALARDGAQALVFCRADNEVLGFMAGASADGEPADPLDLELLANAVAQVLSNHRFYHSMTHDRLSGAYNSAYMALWLDELTKDFSGLTLKGLGLGVVMGDLDRFKKVNDTYGHPAGDAAIVNYRLAFEAAQAEFAGRLHPASYFIRYGGEEFIAVLVAKAEGMDALLRDYSLFLCDWIANNPVTWEGKPIPLTASIGAYAATAECAKLIGEGKAITVDAFYKPADDALYIAKRSACSACGHSFDERDVVHETCPTCGSGPVVHGRDRAVIGTEILLRGAGKRG